MKKILIIGATSAIAQAIAREYAKRKDKLYLVARNEELLNSLAKDLAIRGASDVNTARFEATNFASHEKLIVDANDKLDSIDIAFVVHGTLPDQNECQENVESAIEAININCTSYISILTHLANFFKKQQNGSIAVFGSPAGDRGRQSNYVYGSAKAAVGVFTQGVRNSLHESGVHVMTIKPGFIDTPMTVNFDKGFLWSQPEKIAPKIISAIDSKKDIIYAPWFWRYIMIIIKFIPEILFKRLKL